jgi:hypothetical protein
LLAHVHHACKPRSRATGLTVLEQLGNGKILSSILFWCICINVFQLIDVSFYDGYIHLSGGLFSGAFDKNRKSTFPLSSAEAI